MSPASGPGPLAKQQQQHALTSGAMSGRRYSPLAPPAGEHGEIGYCHATPTSVAQQSLPQVSGGGSHCVDCAGESQPLMPATEDPLASSPLAGPPGDDKGSALPCFSAGSVPRHGVPPVEEATVGDVYTAAQAGDPISQPVQALPAQGVGRGGSGAGGKRGNRGNGVIWTHRLLLQMEWAPWTLQALVATPEPHPHLLAAPAQVRAIVKAVLRALAYLHGQVSHLICASFIVLREMGRGGGVIVA